MVFENKVVVLTGGTNGIGAATALELKKRGAHVWIIGRSAEKGNRLVQQAANESDAGSLAFLQADFSLMSNVRQTVETLQQTIRHIDILIHCVGILIAHKEYTREGIEKDFAVGYLSRFVMTRELVQQGLLTGDSLMVNLAASDPKVPNMARLEFDDLATVEARYGMQSHGQAQIANDLFSLEAASRWGLAAIGYGPGSVDTGIRRELPRVLVTLMKPLFWFTTRQPAEVARQLAGIIEHEAPPPSSTWFFNKKGRFEPDPFVLDSKRRADAWSVSERLSAKAAQQPAPEPAP